MELKEALTKYKKYTIKLIDAAENEEYYLIEDLLNNREELINNIKEIKYADTEFKDLVYDLNIMLLEEKLKNIMLIKKNNIRNDLENLVKSTSANTKYSNKVYQNSLFFNKEI